MHGQLLDRPADVQVCLEALGGMGASDDVVAQGLTPSVSVAVRTSAQLRHLQVRDPHLLCSLLMTSKRH